MSNTVIYKVSYVVEGGEHPGAIINVEKEPLIGDVIKFGGKVFEITDIQELMPPMGDFGFLHATCKYIEDAK